MANFLFEYFDNGWYVFVAVWIISILLVSATTLLALWVIDLIKWVKKPKEEKIIDWINGK